MFKVEIFKEDRAESFSYPAKDGKPAGIVWFQYGYIDLGGRFPVKVSVPLAENLPYPPGKYILSPDSFYVDTRTQLAINPYAVKLLIDDSK